MSALGGERRDAQKQERASLFECLRLALAEDRGALIALMYDMPSTDLERLVEAAQMIDSEGLDVLEPSPGGSAGWAAKELRIAAEQAKRPIAFLLPKKVTE
jgi:hypothetical protein